MAFVDVRLPEDVERGAQGGPQFSTTIFPSSSGHEKRNENWADTRGAWDVGYGIQTKSDFDNTIDFFYARHGRAIGFRFKDWTDFEIIATGGQQIGLGDDSTTIFQALKTYTSGGATYSRDLKKLVTGTVKVYLETVLQTVPGQVSFDVDTGLITFVTAPLSTTGSGPGGEQIVGLETEFDVPVRFDTDHLQLAAETFDAAAIPQIPILEIRDIA